MVNTWTRWPISHILICTKIYKKVACSPSKKEEIGQYQQKADPELDAWMLVTGKLRQVFDLNAFIKRHADIFVPLQQLRKKLNVLVLESRCPVNKALDSARNKAQTGNATERPEVQSQTFWTTVKSWIGQVN